MEFKKGAIVDHERYGTGVILKVTLTGYEIIFERGGKMNFSKSNTELTLLEDTEDNADSEETRVTLTEATRAIEMVLEKYNVLHQIVEMGEKWEGGTIILQPGNKELKTKEIPIEVFFHKIVMLRDRLRVLEQNINSHPKLSDSEKIDLQQYITRIYGSLTTFNLLFKEKNDYFVGSGG